MTRSDRLTDSMVERIARVLRTRQLSLAVAESLTGGLLSARFAAGLDASQWYRGGIVAYTREVKQKVLAVGNGPLVSEQTALEMVRGVSDLLSSNIAVAVTGAAGPDGLDGADPGDAWIAVRRCGDTTARRFTFTGDPAEICEQTCRAAIELVAVGLGASRP